MWPEQSELIEIFLVASITSSGFRVNGIENSAGIRRSDVPKPYIVFAASVFPSVKWERCSLPLRMVVGIYEVMCPLPLHAGAVHSKHSLLGALGESALRVSMEVSLQCNTLG